MFLLIPSGIGVFNEKDKVTIRQFCFPQRPRKEYIKCVSFPRPPMVAALDRRRLSRTLNTGIKL